MSHWVVAREVLGDPDIACLVRQCMQRAFADGFSLQELDYPPSDPAVEIVVNQLDSERT